MFGGPIAHAHLTLGAIPHLREGLFTFARGECMFYGCNRVRFPTAVLVGARIRLRAQWSKLPRSAVAEQLTVDLRVEIEGSERPGCVAQAIWRHYTL